MRVDKWLWVARLAKTRALAAEAVRGGRVKVNGQPVKPAREVGAGDRLELSFGERRMEVFVRDVAPRRGPASEAALLYEETEASRLAREQRAAEARLSAPVPGRGGGRPTKRDRRRLDAARRGARGG
jgi:ribosome-associated heat shock protein Hsp15